MPSNRFGAHKRTGADKRMSLTMALGQMSDEHILAIGPADLVWTGAPPREIECQLLAKQARIRRERGL